MFQSLWGEAETHTGVGRREEGMEGWEEGKKPRPDKHHRTDFGKSTHPEKRFFPARSRWGDGASPAIPQPGLGGLVPGSCSEAMGLWAMGGEGPDMLGAGGMRRQGRVGDPSQMPPGDNRGRRLEEAPAVRPRLGLSRDALVAVVARGAAQGGSPASRRERGCCSGAGGAALRARWPGPHQLRGAAAPRRR